MSIMRNASIVAALYVFFVFTHSAGAIESVCREGCATGATDCMRVPGSSIDFDLSDPLVALRNALADLRRERISPREILGMFGLDEDPCDRSVSRLGHQLSNEGRSCILLTSFESKLIEEAVAVRVVIPELLRGNLLRDGRSAVVRFHEVSQSPFLDVDDPLLAELLSGRVESVEFFEDAAFSVVDAFGGRMCVEIFFED